MHGGQAGGAAEDEGEGVREKPAADGVADGTVPLENGGDAAVTRYLVE